jgi:hypothetical protein
MSEKKTLERGEQAGGAAGSERPAPRLAPLSMDEVVREKLDLCAAHSVTTIPERTLEQLTTTIRGLEEVRDTGAIIGLLTP